MSIAPLPHTRGSIGANPQDIPALRLCAERIVANAQDFLTPWQEAPFPTACIDGRPTDAQATGQASTSDLRLAGGTVSVWVGALLSAALPLPLNVEAATAGLGDFCQNLHRLGFALSTHTDDHAAGNNCGCGAADHLGAVLRLIETEPEAVQGMLDSWGIVCPDFSVVVDRARSMSPAVTGVGSQINQTIASVSSSANIEVQGGHREVLTIINTRPHCSVNRAKVMAALAAGGLGTDENPAQVFVVDLWALGMAASILGFKDSQQATFIAAGAAFNAAALSALSGPTMLVCTL